MRAKMLHYALPFFSFTTTTTTTTIHHHTTTTTAAADAADAATAAAAAAATAAAAAITHKYGAAPRDAIPLPIYHWRRFHGYIL